MKNGEKVQADYEMLKQWSEVIAKMKTEPERIIHEYGDGTHLYSLGQGASGHELVAQQLDRDGENFYISYRHYNDYIGIQYRTWPNDGPDIIFLEEKPGGPSLSLGLSHEGRYSYDDSRFWGGEPSEFTQLVNDGNYSLKEILEKLRNNSDYESPLMDYQELADVWLELCTDIENIAKQIQQPTQEVGEQSAESIITKPETEKQEIIQNILSMQQIIAEQNEQLKNEPDRELS